MTHQLAVDTSGSFCSVALQRADGVVFHAESEGNGDHFERLSPLVESVSAQAQVPVADLAQVVIGLGPGSFTGLRIGMSFVKGLSCAVRIPLVGRSSFHAIARRRAMTADAEITRVLVVSDARRQEVFRAEYEVRGGEVSEVQAAEIVAEDTVRAWLERTGGVVVTPLRDWAIPGVQMVVESRISEGLLALGGSFGEFSVSDVALLEPDYIRGVSAKSIAERTGA